MGPQLAFAWHVFCCASQTCEELRLLRDMSVLRRSSGFVKMSKVHMFDVWQDVPDDISDDAIVKATLAHGCVSAALAFLVLRCQCRVHVERHRARQRQRRWRRLKDRCVPNREMPLIQSALRHSILRVWSSALDMSWMIQVLSRPYPKEGAKFAQTAPTAHFE